MPARVFGPLTLALFVALATAWAVRAQDRPAAAPVWQYRLLTWERADTEAVLRRVTGQQMASVEEMLRRMADQLQPIEDPRLQVAVSERLAERLQAEGAEGWEAFWVRETNAVISGYAVPAPSVLLRRRG